MPRAKRMKKVQLNSIRSIDEYLLINSTSECQLNNTRVVVNPAVLRYLEQSRLGSSKPLISLDDDLSSSSWENQTTEMNYQEDEFFADFSSYSNEFLATARLARWILDHHGHLSRTIFSSSSNIRSFH